MLFLCFYVGGMFAGSVCFVLFCLLLLGGAGYLHSAELGKPEFLSQNEFTIKLPNPSTSKVIRGM